MPDQFSDVHRSISPASAAQQQVTLFCPATNQQGLQVWSGCELHMLAVGNALLGLQTFSFLKTKKQFKFHLFNYKLKEQTLVYRCEGASIFSSGLCFCFSRWGRYRCQQLGQTWRHWPYNRSLPCMPINHSSLVTNNNKIKLFEIGKVCLWLSEQKLFFVFLWKWSHSGRKKEPSATAQLLVWKESSIYVQSASQDMDWTVNLDQAAALGRIDTERWVVQ